MQNDREKWQTTSETLIQSKLERLKSLSPEEAGAVRAEWDTLLADVNQAMAAHEPPDGPVAQALADRWLQRLERLMGTPLDASMVQHAAAYQARGDRPSNVDKRVWDFMSQALARRK